MLHTRTCRHNLHVRRFDDLRVAHAIFVFEVAFYADTHDFHIVVWVRAEAHAARDNIVVQHAQSPKIHAFWVVITSETERKIRVEPTVISVSASVSGVENGVLHI